MRKLKYIKLFENFRIFESIWYSGEKEEYFRDFFNKILTTNKSEHSKSSSFPGLDQRSLSDKQIKINRQIEERFYIKFGPYELKSEIFLEGQSNSPIYNYITLPNVEDIRFKNPFLAFFTDKELGIGQDDNQDNAKHRAEIRTYKFTITENNNNIATITITNKQEQNKLEIQAQGKIGKEDENIKNIINWICDICNGSIPTETNKSILGVLGIWINGNTESLATMRVTPEMILSKF
jgi:hypothetical protein